MILDVSGNYLPHIICQYIYDTTKNFSAFYTNIPILSEENEAIKNSRIALVG
jgi:arginyl-tRNA synthetase